MAEAGENDPNQGSAVGDRFGKFFGEHVLMPALDLAARRVERFDITHEGLKNLSQITNRSCLLVSNHLIPMGAVAQQSQLSPDAFVIQHVVTQMTGISPRIVAKAGDGWWSPNALHRAFQEKTLPVIMEAVRAAGLIPLNKNPGAINREFLHSVEQTVRNGDSLLMFPEGFWYIDFNPNHPLHDGASYLAMKYDLPIIPVYIHGANGWKKRQNVYVSFGTSFESVGNGKEGREQTTELIRSAIADLQSHFPS